MRNVRFTIILLLVGILILAMPLSLKVSADEPALNCLILNQTRTRFGNELYRHFCDLWGEPRVDFQHTIVVREIPDPRWGSLLTIDINDHQAYRKTLQPRSSLAREEAEDALPRVRDYLIYLMRTDGNGGSEDLKGDGY